MKALASMLLLCGAVAGCGLQNYNSTSQDDAKFGGNDAAGDPNDPKYQRFSAASIVLQNKCSSCHEWAGYSENKLLNLNKINATDGLKSVLYTRLQRNGGDMPQAGSLSDAEFQKIKDWLSQNYPAN